MITLCTQYWYDLKGYRKFSIGLRLQLANLTFLLFSTHIAVRFRGKNGLRTEIVWKHFFVNKQKQSINRIGSVYIIQSGL